MIRTTLIKILSLFCISVFISQALFAQCDVELIYYDYDTHEVSITVHNGSGCTGDGVQKLQLGMHKPGLDSNWMYCSTPMFHPGYVWFPTINWDSAISTNAVPGLDPDGDGYLTEGDTCTFNILDLPYIQNDYYWCWFEMVEQAYADGCVEIVLWQINLSQTSHVWEGGWATSPSGTAVGNYPDVNVADNSVAVEETCYCVTDTIYLMVFPGCTDPYALNYDPEATEDNGTCVYSIGPDPIIIDIVVLAEECQVLDTGLLMSFDYEVTLVNIGTEAVTYFCLHDFLGLTYNCFNGVSNLAVWMQPGDTLTVSGTIQGSETWSPGAGNFMTVESVPNEIITGNNNYVFYMPEGIECEEPPEYCDTLLVYVQVLDTLIIQLPPDTLTIFEVDTLIVFQVDTLIEYVTLPPDTVFVPWEYYYYDTIYVDVIDTLYISLVDTVIVTVTELEWVYVTDTVFINTTDTLYITQVDTVMQEVLVYEYIFQTDTIYDIVYSEILIDCASGLPCGDGAIGDDCNSVFVPNAFSPNNDGINDSFYAASNSYLCWLDWHILVYNRWGEVVWQSTDPESQWYGEAQSGSHYVSDGVYIWTLRAKGVEGNVLDLQGHLTLFR